MVIIKGIACYLVAFIVLAALSVIFMGGAFITFIPFVAIFVAIVIYRSIFKVRYMRDAD